MNLPENDRNEESQPAQDGGSASSLPPRRLAQIFGGSGEDPLPEILRIFLALCPTGELQFIERLHSDLIAIFRGEYPGFRDSIAQYHDLRHTWNVALATIRLMHGLKVQQRPLPEDVVKLTMVCAYFHDTGMLLTDNDVEKVGAAYLKYHEERSVDFVIRYIHEHDLPSWFSEHCPPIINCTNLTLEPDSLAFSTKEIQTAGFILGTADVLAQMADRYYLECLPQLFNEQRAAGIHQHASALALMRQTANFYHQVIERRLNKSLGGMYLAMRDHFQAWWHLDGDLYMSYLIKNIDYLEEVLDRYDNGEGKLTTYLRRKQPKVE